MKEALWLIRNGVPFDVAFELDQITRTGWCIIFSEFEGSEFDFGSWEYKRPERNEAFR